MRVEKVVGREGKRDAGRIPGYVRGEEGVCGRVERGYDGVCEEGEEKRDKGEKKLHCAVSVVVGAEGKECAGIVAAKTGRCGAFVYTCRSCACCDRRDARE